MAEGFLLAGIRIFHRFCGFTFRLRHQLLADMASKHVVFSYGTLKSGEPNYEVMTNPETGSAVYLGSGETVNKYPLVVASQYAIPFLLLAEGKGKNVEGEVYEIDDAKLARLDEFEDHPDFYRREKVSIAMTTNQQHKPIDPPEIRQCWVYFLPRYKPEMIDLPYLKRYNSASKDHPPYVESEDVHSLDQID